LWVGNEISFGTITHIPCFEGDLLHMEIDGKDHIINPRCRELCEIVEINKTVSPKMTVGIKSVGILSSEDGDWTGLYLDGKLIAENHSLSNWDWVQLLSSLGIGVQDEERSMEWFEKVGSRCPETWDEVMESEG
jgi:hypothetical protein